MFTHRLFSLKRGEIRHNGTGVQKMYRISLAKKRGRNISRNRQRAVINLEGPKLVNCVMSDIEEIKNMAPEAREFVNNYRSSRGAVRLLIIKFSRV